MQRRWTSSPGAQKMHDNVFEAFLRHEQVIDARQFLCLDFGECLTIHKSQGSQWSRVCVVWDRGMQGKFYHDHAFWQRLLYTAITRASETCIVLRLRKDQSPV